MQTSDAGPGVSSHEKISQLRMAEYFMINYLDLQCRFHYAPGDSSCHLVERVMRFLNECLGDGRVIPVSTNSLLDSKGKIKLRQIDKDELRILQAEQEAQSAKMCAASIKNRFHGKKCMGTSIHATTPCYEKHKQFFFDDEYMSKCANASSSTALEKCAGKTYYMFVSNFFADHYVLYDNGFEGIRDGCTTQDGKVCNFHATYENTNVLSCGWSGVPVSRIHPPIPDYYSAKDFHYLTPKQMSSHQSSSKDDNNNHKGFC